MKIIIEKVRGKWVVDESTKEFLENVGYGDGALIELEVTDLRSLCCHPDNPVVCSHKEGI